MLRLHLFCFKFTNISPLARLCSLSAIAPQRQHSASFAHSLFIFFSVLAGCFLLPLPDGKLPDLPPPSVRAPAPACERNSGGGGGKHGSQRMADHSETV